MPISDTSQQLEVLLAVRRERGGTLGAQIEAQLRTAIRDGALRAGVQLPSTRDLAGQLGLSRRIVVEAYAQLAAEGYLSLRQGARPTVARNATPPRRRPTRSPSRHARASTSASAPPTCRPSRARAGCARCATRSRRSPTPSSATATRAASSALRTALADYLGRVRGVVADPAQVIVTFGYARGRAWSSAPLRSAERRGSGSRIRASAITARCARAAGLEPVPIEVDEHGLRVDRLREPRATPSS